LYLHNAVDDDAMRQYLDLVERVLRTGTYKPNRTGVDTVAAFGQDYAVDLAEGFPLLTTKDLSGSRWHSLVHEFLWYLSGEEHVRNLREKTGIWDAWADEEGRLDTAYGRFWRRYPVPDEDDRLPGEAWPDDADRWITDEGTFDQIRYALDTLRERPHSRRIVVNAWHPANAAVSTLPPCHYTFVFTLQVDRLNLHLTHQSGDVAVGIPFNLAAYAMLAQVVAGRTDLRLGRFHHTIVDAHVYCGRGARGEWYADHLDELASRVADVERPEGVLDVREWVEASAPEEDQAGYDHVPGLLLQCSRTPRERPRLSVAGVPIDDLTFDDIELHDYDPAPGIRFEVAE
jgi:thymidylate synthase